MDELQFNNQQLPEWKETARWIKFEEDVEKCGRWSKPHVATLSLCSLFELRNCILNGIVLLDLNCEDFCHITDIVIAELIKQSYLNEEHQDELRAVLLARHIHQHEKLFHKNLDTGEKKPLPLIRSLAEIGKRLSNKDMKENSENKFTGSIETTNTLSVPHIMATLKQSSTAPVFDLHTSSKDELNRSKSNANFMKKIPKEAEASNILVGETEYLDRPLSVFVRLSKPLILCDLTEVPIPTRFIFISLGPIGYNQHSVEIGRSMATLMIDEMFHDIAYNADSRHSLLAGIDDFLGQVTVLPPGEWHPSLRLDPPVKVMEREERLKLQESAAKDIKGPARHRKNSELHYHELDPCLDKTGKFAGGLIGDIQRKLPWYWSDFKDGFNMQCLSSILFLYFACLAPIITFGGLLSVATDRNMAAIESMLSGAICGITYHMFSGQPLTILGSTGPVLVFETIINTFCKEFDIDYLGFRAWIGMWTCIFLLIIVLFDLSFTVRYITRFTEESFAVLIGFIFIRESITKLLQINSQFKYSVQPSLYAPIALSTEDRLSCYKCEYKRLVNETSNSTLQRVYMNLTESQCKSFGSDYSYVQMCEHVPDVFLFSVLLFIFTFILAIKLKNFKNTRYLPASIRAKISDFAVVISILFNVIFDYIIGFNTPKLQVPSELSPTRSDRTWVVDPIERMNGKWWIVFAAIIPSILATILIFMDQHITVVIVNRKENKLKKSCGYHLDLLIVALCIGINSLLGIPWFVAATVLSINHVISLKKESETSAPGEKRKFLGIIEQRLTGTVTFLLIGCSVFMTNLLSTIPMPVLYGVFLYMGVTSLRDIHFIQRLLIIFMPQKYQPPYPYIKTVRTSRIHLFTVIQLICLVLLFAIKMYKPTSIGFPLMVLALVFIRKAMDYLFTQKELSYLDDLLPIVEQPKTADDVFDDCKSFKKTTEIELENLDISKEISKTSIWKRLALNKKSPKKLLDTNGRNRHSHGEKNNNIQTDENVTSSLLNNDSKMN